MHLFCYCLVLISSFPCLGKTVLPDWEVWYLHIFWHAIKQKGPSCSKLTVLLVNVSLNMAYMLIFLLKNVSSF